MIAGGDEGDEAELDEAEGGSSWADGSDDFESDGDEGEEEDGWMLDDDDEGEGLLPPGLDDDAGPALLPGNVAWGEAGLRVARRVLEAPENAQLALYLFRAVEPSRTIEVRLDRLDDAYGSPDMDDIERFSRALLAGLEDELGPEEAGLIGLEVSSPGAERTLQLPQDLLRFKELPLRVDFANDAGGASSLVLTFLALDEAAAATSWALAEVKANQAVKGRGLTRKQREQRFDIPLAALQRVRIHVEL